MADVDVLDPQSQRMLRYSDLGSGAAYAPLMSARAPFLSEVTVSVTRPANTTAYLANDVVGSTTSAGGAVLTFADLAPPGGGHFLLNGSSLLVESSGIISGETSYTLHVYKTSPASALADNDPFDVPAGDRAAYLGSINLGAVSDLGSTLLAKNTFTNNQYVAASSTIYAYLVTVGPYTPTSGRVFSITLRTIGL